MVLILAIIVITVILVVIDTDIVTVKTIIIIDTFRRSRHVLSFQDAEGCQSTTSARAITLA